MDNSVFQEMCESAVVENELTKGFHAINLKESGSDYDGEISKRALITPFSNKYIVSLLENPVSFKEFKSFDPNVRATSGFYTIRYVPLHHKDRVKGKPYIIGQDLIRLRVTVSGPRHWGALCDRIPELAWIKRNSTYTDELFAIAKMHPGMVIRFVLDVPRYCRMITQKAEERGIDIDHKPLVGYGCSASDYINVYRKKELSEPRTKADYVKELAEVEKTAKEEYKGD